MVYDANPVEREVDRVEGEEVREEGFNFTEHRRIAVEEYRRVRPQYEAFSQVVREILDQSLRSANIKVNSVDARAKELASFGAKAEVRADHDPEAPKYRKPLSEITDLTGVRVIAFFPRAIQSIGDCIQKEFDVIEHADHSQRLLEEERFGYHSEHYLVKLSSNRTALPEYERYSALVAEIQVRTVLQHAWAEIEHDIQYKSPVTTPDTIRRRFMALAGVLEIADREFQAIQDEDKQLKMDARASVARGALDQVEITADALRSYLDRRVGPDARSTDFSYEYTARLLRRLGFTTFDQVDTCIEGYDGDELSRIRWQHRQGSITRFEEMLLVGMGTVFVERRTDDSGWREFLRRDLAKYKERGITIGNYDPTAAINGKSPSQ